MSLRIKTSIVLASLLILSDSRSQPPDIPLPQVLSSEQAQAFDQYLRAVRDLQARPAKRIAVALEQLRSGIRQRDANSYSQALIRLEKEYQQLTLNQVEQLYTAVSKLSTSAASAIPLPDPPFSVLTSFNATARPRRINCSKPPNMLTALCFENPPGALPQVLCTGPCSGGCQVTDQQCPSGNAVCFCYEKTDYCTCSTLTIVK